MTRWLPALATLLLAGCASASINPFLAYTREDGVEFAPGSLRLVCAVGSPDAAERIQRAVQTAVTASGGGAVQALSGIEREHLLDLLRAKGGAAFPATVKHYEATIVARIRDSLAPMRIVWTLGTESVSLDVDGDAVKLLEDEERPNKYRLLIDAGPGALTVPGDQVVRKSDHAGFSFKAPAFKLYLKTGSHRINFRLLSEVADLFPEERMLFLEITGFQGDVNALNSALLSEDLRRDDEDGLVRFVHYDTVMFLGAAVVADPDAADEADEADPQTEGEQADPQAEADD